MTAALVALQRPPSDLAEHLRSMADAADRGDLVDCVMCYTLNGDFEFRFGTSGLTAIAMASMLHTAALERMRT